MNGTKKSIQNIGTGKSGNKHTYRSRRGKTETSKDTDSKDVTEPQAMTTTHK
jgi:hypothetical protein